MNKSKEMYLESLIIFTKYVDMPIRVYFEDYAKKLRSGKKLNLMKWEMENPFLSSKDIIKLIDSDDEDICKYFALAMEKVINLNLDEMQKERMQKKELVPVNPTQALVPVEKKEEPVVTEESLTRSGIEEIIEENMPKNEDKLTRKDIEETIEDNMPVDEYINKKDIEEMIDEKINAISPLKIVLANISRKVQDLLNGFAVVRESKTGRTNLYYHDAKNDTLRGKTTFYNNQLNVESGYYVNYDEYLNKILNEVAISYPDAIKLSFVRNDGEERTFSEVAEEAFTIARQEGAIRFGKAIQGKNIASYQEFVDMNLKGDEEYQGELLRTGFYVRRDVLVRIFNCYKIRVQLSKRENKEEKGIQK